MIRSSSLVGSNWTEGQWQSLVDHLLDLQRVQSSWGLASSLLVCQGIEEGQQRRESTGRPTRGFAAKEDLLTGVWFEEFDVTWSVSENVTTEGSVS